MRPLNGPPNVGLVDLDNTEHMIHGRQPTCAVCAIGFSMHPSRPPAAAPAVATMVRVGGG